MGLLGNAGKNNSADQNPTVVRAKVEALKERPRASVLIIGGGINGVGPADSDLSFNAYAPRL